VAGLVLVSALPARAQLTTMDEERLRILADPDAAKKKAEEKKLKPPFECFRSQVAPFDVLPYVKAHHWSTLTLELQANEADYDGLLQTDPVPMPPMPLEMVFRREARLVKEQTRAPSQQVLVNMVPKEWTLTLLRPNALRGDASWPAILILVLSKDSPNRFATWGRMAAMIPARTDREAIQQVDRQRYYRLVLPSEPDKLALSSHPLTWSTISHVVWDALPPDSLSVSQQQALLDWLHWGGQLIFTGGVDQSYALSPGRPTWQPQHCGRPRRSRSIYRSFSPPRVPRRSRWARGALTCWRSSAGSAADESRCSRLTRPSRHSRPGRASTPWSAG
jgi:hypothetical protein